MRVVWLDWTPATVILEWRDDGTLEKKTIVRRPLMKAYRQLCCAAPDCSCPDEPFVFETAVVDHTGQLMDGGLSG